MLLMNEGLIRGVISRPLLHVRDEYFFHSGVVTTRSYTLSERSFLMQSVNKGRERTLQIVTMAMMVALIFSPPIRRRAG